MTYTLRKTKLVGVRKVGCLYEGAIIFSLEFPFPGDSLSGDLVPLSGWSGTTKLFFLRSPPGITVAFCVTLNIHTNHMHLTNENLQVLTHGGMGYARDFHVSLSPSSYYTVHLIGELSLLLPITPVRAIFLICTTS